MPSSTAPANNGEEGQGGGLVGKFDGFKDRWNDATEGMNIKGPIVALIAAIAIIVGLGILGYNGAEIIDIITSLFDD